MVAVWQGRDRGGGAHAGQDAKAVQHVAVVGDALVGFVILVVGERQPHGEHGCRIQPFAVVHQLAESANHQPGADQQDHRQGDFGGHQDVAQAMTRAARGASAAAFLEGVGEVGAGALPRRREASQDAAQYCRR